MTDEEYNAYQLDKVSDEDNDHYVIKIQCDKTLSETKWLTITPAQFEAIRKALT